MRQMMMYVCGLALAVLMLSATSAHAQTTAVGPYYATPSWDQRLQCDTLPTCPRFVVLSNLGSNAVLDRETGLVRVRAPDPTFTNFFSWYQAQDYCINLTLGSRLGWRLPTIQELTSLIDGDNATANPPLLAGHPFIGLVNHAFWSATTSAQFPGYAHNLYFFGSLFPGERAYSFQLDPQDGHDSKPDAWCVRGGVNVEPQ
jgi:hypothetical protein